MNSTRETETEYIHFTGLDLAPFVGEMCKMTKEHSSNEWAQNRIMWKRIRKTRRTRFYERGNDGPVINALLRHRRTVITY